MRYVYTIGTFFAAMLLLLTGASAALALGVATVLHSHEPLAGTNGLHGCVVDFYMDPGWKDALVFFYLPNSLEISPGGAYYYDRDPVAASGGAITESHLKSLCDFSSVTNISVDGADSNYDADDYFGISFDAILNGQTAIYHYEMALSGVTSTSIINTRTLVFMNTPPTANAGADQTVGSAASVTLDGSGSTDPDSGQTLTHAWTQSSGPAVTLSDATMAAPDFTAPTLARGAPPEVLTFSLTVNDGTDDSTPDTVQITVTAPPNTAPTANAGTDQTVGSAASVTLDGSGSSAQDVGQSLTYRWTQTAGPTATLSDAATANPGFTAPVLAIAAADVVLSFELTVHDGLEESPATSVQITVEATPNVVPIANTGGDLELVAEPGAIVRLDGSASSANDPGQSLTYAWSQTGGPAVVLIDATQPVAGFIAPEMQPGDAAQRLSFQLVVNDGITASAPVVLQVTVLPPADATRPTALLAFAGDSYLPGSTITVSITFSEPVTGLETGDLGSNGRVVSLSGSGAHYSVLIATPETGERLSVALAADAAEDAAGNPTLAAMPLSIHADLSEMAREVTAEGMKARGRALIAAQPRLRSFFDPAGGTGNAMMLADTGDVDLAYVSEAGWWLNAQGEWSTIDDAETGYGNLTLGAHVVRGQNNILGVMMQLDHSKTVVSDPHGRFIGDGWLVGPYWVGRMPDQPLVFSASWLCGWTDNSVFLPGLTRDDFGGKRWLLTAGVEGRYGLPNGAFLIPSLDLSRLKDSADAYTDSRGDFVAGQQIAMTEVEFGLGLEVPVAVQTGSLTLRVGMSGTYARIRSGIEHREDWRGGLDLGLDYALSNNGGLRFSIYHDGLGQDAYRASGIDLSYKHVF